MLYANLVDLTSDDSIEDFHSVGRAAVGEDLSQNNGLMGVDVKSIDLDNLLKALEEILWHASCIIHGYIRTSDVYKVLHVPGQAIVIEPVEHSFEVGVEEEWEFEGQAICLTMTIIKSYHAADHREVLRG